MNAAVEPAPVTMMACVGRGSCTDVGTPPLSAHGGGGADADYVGRVRTLFTGLRHSRDEAEAAELQAELSDDDVSTICQCRPGEQVVLSGTVRSVTFRPREQAPALEVELYDGTGCVSVVWLGRRRIPGIDPGRRMTVWGRMTCTDQPRIFNPRYRLNPAA